MADRLAGNYAVLKIFLIYKSDEKYEFPIQPHGDLGKIPYKRINSSDFKGKIKTGVAGCRGAKVWKRKRG